ncbi:MAG: hypothetical protein A2754_01490, partial [Candidatus Magasanikbacteria bacterium RIFCSPHIGHO2_01_FULL_47_8]
MAITRKKFFIISSVALALIGVLSLYQLLGSGIEKTYHSLYSPPHPMQYSQFSGSDSGFQGTYRAKVLEIIQEEERIVEGTNIKAVYQLMKVKFLEGPKKDDIVEFENDYILLKKGDTFFMDYFKLLDGEEGYNFQEVDRKNPILLLFLVFLVPFLLLTGLKGFRSLVSLFGTFFIIMYFLLPRLLEGSSPVATSIFFAVAILAVVMYITHGVNRLTHAAFIGTTLTVAVVALVAEISVSIARLSGIASEEALYLNIGTDGTLDFTGIFLGAIIIGAIGVLDDVAVTQSSAVKELRNASSELSRSDIFLKAMRIGKDHVSSLVNTLALAYTGASLPLLLLFSLSDTAPML